MNDQARMIIQSPYIQSEMQVVKRAWESDLDVSMIAFGESVLDLAMGHGFCRQRPVGFVFLGPAEIIDADDVFSIIRTQSHYECGAIEYPLRVVPCDLVQEENYYV